MLEFIFVMFFLILLFVFYSGAISLINAIFLQIAVKIGVVWIDLLAVFVFGLAFGIVA